MDLFPPSYPWYVLGYPNHLGMATSTMQTVISCIINIVSRCFSGTQPQIIAATCGRFHAVILQEASDHVPQVSDQFIACTGGTGLAILLSRDTCEPNAAVSAFHEASSSKDTWGMAVFVARGLLRRPSLSGTPTVTFVLCPHSQCCGQKEKNAMPPLTCSDDYVHP